MNLCRPIIICLSVLSLEIQLSEESFVDIGGIVDHQCLNFIFIMGNNKTKYHNFLYNMIPFHDPFNYLLQEEYMYI